ncbi:hypothetical protein JCM19000A_42070 [Silvimonas sp. JCM 19000]
MATTDRFPANSRYANSETSQLPQADGHNLVYLKRRFVPDPDQYVTLQLYRVVEGDRIDRMAAAVLGDPLQFWRMLDANGCLQAGELEEIGRRIRLTLPQGIPGYPNLGGM